MGGRRRDDVVPKPAESVMALRFDSLTASQSDRTLRTMRAGSCVGPWPGRMGNSP